MGRALTNRKKTDITKSDVTESVTEFGNAFSAHSITKHSLLHSN